MERCELLGLLKIKFNKADLLSKDRLFHRRKPAFALVFFAVRCFSHQNFNSPVGKFAGQTEHSVA